MSVKLNENWQEGKTLQECNLFLLENEYSDVIFRLHYKNEKKEEEVADIPALRTLCLSRSPVFFAMFAGELAQQPDNPVHEIHDDYADPQAFKQLVCYMYTDDVVLTADNVLSVLYLSQKYIVRMLTKKCMKFLEENLTPETAPILLEQSMLYEEKELKEKTLATIQEEAPAVLASEEFLELSTEALGEVLKLNLKIEKEVTVFNACMKWAKNQCEKLKKSPGGENIREVIGSNLYQIRFPTMSAEEFSEVVAPQDVLSDKEGYQVLRCISAKSNRPYNIPFKTEPRVQVDTSPRNLVIPAPYTTSSITLPRQGLTNIVTTLSCTVSKPLCIRRIYVHPYTAISIFISRQVTVTLKQNGKCLHESTGQPAVTSAGQLPEHYTIDVDDVRVEAGAMELVIKLALTNGWGSRLISNINLSSHETNQLADDYTTISFPPVGENLLLGIEYRIP